VDVALFYGKRSGGIRTYLDAKRRYAARTGAFEHHVVVPGRESACAAGWHELRSWPLTPSNGYRIPAGGGLRRKLADLEPDVVLLHDPFWTSPSLIQKTRAAGTVVIAVHHGSIELDARALPIPPGLSRPFIRGWMRRAYRGVDEIMAVTDPRADSGRVTTLPLRLGLDAAFRPHPEVIRGDHVLYVGRLGREKGVMELVDAASASADPWPLRLVGSGPIERALRARVTALGLERRVSFLPFVADREGLARLYASSRCTVMPGRFETFGLVALEAAASGARVVVCANAPAATACGPLATTFQPGEQSGLLAAIERARAAPPPGLAARALSQRFAWEQAFQDELADLESVLG
jgi:alpha-1,6-mannosyltransferase